MGSKEIVRDWNARCKVITRRATFPGAKLQQIQGQIAGPLYHRNDFILPAWGLFPLIFLTSRRTAHRLFCEMEYFCEASENFDKDGLCSSASPKSVVSAAVVRGI